ncbi:nucleotidyltransferase family protein [Aquimarina celericrescens]|uniref:NTP transferase domain-containing protein n=1 Tax=Aquimarina celericrescens TaxID=1964542 RepID=A0ABW5ATX2_9FLAO|nr:nucleotidyltransferase family protein [Aquimarina celericrescens]
MSSQTKPKIAHLILAAGASSRMGKPKQLLSWGDTTLIGHAIVQSLSIKEVTTWVILGANYDLIKREVSRFPVTPINNVNWALGIGSSISVGVKTIRKEKSKYNAVLISLIDQPLIDVEHYKTLITEFDLYSNSLVASDLGGRIGVPAIFSKSFFNELELLKEDFGARYIIKNKINGVKVVSAIEKGIDIDTNEQYQAIKKSKFSY